MEEWIKKIEETKSVREMDELIKEMAYDISITNDEYCELYSMAMKRIRRKFI